MFSLKVSSCFAQRVDCVVYRPDWTYTVAIGVKSMAQRKPEEQTTFDQVLKLVENLTPEAQEQLVDQMKLQLLRRELGKAEGQLRCGEGIPAEEAFAQLEERYKRRKAGK